MKKICFFALACIFAVGITSCKKDAEFDYQPTKPLDKDQSFFANIQVCGTDVMTRADYDPENDPGFDKGTVDENKVVSIYFVFYDEKGDRVATTQVRKDNANRYPEGEDESLPGSANSYYSGVVQIDVKHGSLPPAYVMAFINPITSTNFEINPAFESLESLSKTTRPRIIDDTGLFAMSKSVYYGLNRTTGEDNQKIVATPLGKGTLFPTKEEAQEAVDTIEGEESGDSVVKIYVERYAVKVNFSLEEAAKTSTFAVDQQTTLKFIPEYWAVNAYESETYIVKSFMSPTDGVELSYDSLVGAMDHNGDGKADWWWNSPEKHRCYWAQTPAYYASKYPRVADDIIDNGAEDYALGYYSYEEMAKNADGTITAKARKLQETETYPMIYARENTVSGKALRDAYTDPLASPKAAIASVVLVGHYEIDGKTSDFFVTGNATNGYTFFKDDDEMLNFFLKSTVPFSADANGNTIIFNRTTGVFADGYENYVKYFKVDHPEKDAREDVVVDSRFVTIQLEEDAIPATDEDAEIYAYIEGAYVPVSKQHLKEINKEMFYSAGTAQGYNGGKAYFTIPIKHLGFYRSTNEKNKGLNANDKNFDWSEVQTGDFGLVRNHVYTIIVDNIKGLGNGIPDPKDPIVPPTDPEEYFIGARLIVLNWAMIPPQHVTL